MYSIMIVDDEQLIRRGIISLVDFSSLNITTIYEAKNGEQAVALYREKRPDFTLMDINMPNKDGLTTAREIKAINHNAMIAIITGYDFFQYAQTAIKIGVEDYILKPVDKSDILNVVHKMVAKKANSNVVRELKQIKSEQSASKTDAKNAVREFIEANIYDNSLSLANVAEHVGFNKSYLSGIVKQIYGMTFQNYVNQRRMEQAKILLLTTDMKNYQISDAIGYDDVNYFATKFKRTFNLTPKQYRQQVISNSEDQ